MADLGKWMVVEEAPQPEQRKTKRWRILSRKHGTHLGEIRWYGAWRQYTFNPAPATVFNAECLEDIAAFLRRENKR